MQPRVWFRFWFTSSAFGNLVWYLLGSLLSVGALYGIKQAMIEYVPSVDTGAKYFLHMATAANVDLAYTIAMAQLSLNFVVSMAYRLLIVRALATISATCMPKHSGVAHALRIAMAQREVDAVFWVRHHQGIQAVYNRFEVDARRHGTTCPSAVRFERLRAEVNFVIQLYYNPLTIRLFVHSVFAVGVLMALKTGHNLNKDGRAALPFTLFIGMYYAGLLLFIRIADNPFFDDGSGPRLHAHTLQDIADDSRVHPDTTGTHRRRARRNAVVGTRSDWAHGGGSGKSIPGARAPPNSPRSVPSFVSSVGAVAGESGISDDGEDSDTGDGDLPHIQIELRPSYRRQSTQGTLGSRNHARQPIRPALGGTRRTAFVGLGLSNGS